MCVSSVLLSHCLPIPFIQSPSLERDHSPSILFVKELGGGGAGTLPQGAVALSHSRGMSGLGSRKARAGLHRPFPTFSTAALPSPVATNMTLWAAFSTGSVRVTLCGGGFGESLMGATIFSCSWGRQPGEDRPSYPSAVFVALGRSRPRQAPGL